MTGADEVVAFVNARLDEEQAVAENARRSPFFLQTVRTGRRHGKASAAEYLVRRDPEQTLRDVRAMRRIVDNAVRAREAMGSAPIEDLLTMNDGPAAAYWRGCHHAVCAIASRWDSHPDYRKEWGT